MRVLVFSIVFLSLVASATSFAEPEADALCILARLRKDAPAVPMRGVLIATEPRIGDRDTEPTPEQQILYRPDGKTSGPGILLTRWQSAHHYFVDEYHGVSAPRERGGSLDRDAGTFSAHFDFADGVLSPIIETESKNPKKPPASAFIRAADELKNALTHFGDQVRAVDTLWLADSRNRLEFLKNIERGLSPVDAAKATWSGKQLTALGFTEVTSLTPITKKDLRIPRRLARMVFEFRFAKPGSQ